MLNQLTLVGRLASNPDFMETQTGKRFAILQVEVPRDYENRNGERETDWLPCSVWGRNFEALDHSYKQGALVCVTGPIMRKQYTTRSGEERESWQCNVSRLALVEDTAPTSPNNGNGYAHKAQSNRKPAKRRNPLHQQTAPLEEIERPERHPEDDLPF